MAKKRRKRSHKTTIPIAPIIGIVGAPSITAAIDAAMNGRFSEVPNFLVSFIGVNRPQGSFDTGLLIKNMTPVIAGLLVHKFVGGKPLNLNKTLANANVPYLRI